MYIYICIYLYFCIRMWCVRVKITAFTAAFHFFLPGSNVVHITQHAPTFKSTVVHHFVKCWSILYISYLERDVQQTKQQGYWGRRQIQFL